MERQSADVSEHARTTTSFPCVSHKPCQSHKLDFRCEHRSSSLGGEAYKTISVARNDGEIASHNQVEILGSHLHGKALVNAIITDLR